MAMKALLCLAAFGCAAIGHVLPNTDTMMGEGQMISKRAAWLYKQGEYTLSFSSNDEAHEEKAALLRILLDNLYSDLQPIISDLNQTSPQGPPAPSAAYNTFFKDTRNRIYISTLYSNITAGAPVYAPSSLPLGARPYSSTGSPIIMSITEKGQMSGDPDGNPIDMKDWCDANPYVTAAATKSHSRSLPFIILCPFFFDAKPPLVYDSLPPKPKNGKPATNCLQTNPNNRFRKTTGPLQTAGLDLMQYRTWILLHVLADLYHWASTRIVSTNEQDVNRCLDLTPQEALANMPTYAYYAASVYGKCTSFPHTRRGHDGVELLETDGNDPADFGPANATLYQQSLNLTTVELEVNPVLIKAGAVETTKCAPGTCYKYCVCE